MERKLFWYMVSGALIVTGFHWFRPVVRELMSGTCGGAELHSLRQLENIENEKRAIILISPLRTHSQ